MLNIASKKNTRKPFCLSGNQRGAKRIRHGSDYTYDFWDSARRLIATRVMEGTPKALTLTPKIQNFPIDAFKSGLRCGNSLHLVEECKEFKNSNIEVRTVVVNDEIIKKNIIGWHRLDHPHIGHFTLFIGTRLVYIYGPMIFVLRRRPKTDRYLGFSYLTIRFSFVILNETGSLIIPSNAANPNVLKYCPRITERHAMHLSYGCARDMKDYMPEVFALAQWNDIMNKIKRQYTSLLSTDIQRNTRFYNAQKQTLNELDMCIFYDINERKWFLAQVEDLDVFPISKILVHIWGMQLKSTKYARLWYKENKKTGKMIETAKCSKPRKAGPWLPFSRLIERTTILLAGFTLIDRELSPEFIKKIQVELNDRSDLTDTISSPSLVIVSSSADVFSDDVADTISSTPPVVPYISVAVSPSSHVSSASDLCEFFNVESKTKEQDNTN